MKDFTDDYENAQALAKEYWLEGDMHLKEYARLLSKQYGYWSFDGQIHWFTKLKIPMTKDRSWSYHNV